MCLFRRKDYVCACPDVPDDRPCEKGKQKKKTTVNYVRMDFKNGGGGVFSVEPKEKITIPKSDDDDDDLIIHGVDGGTKSELDKIHGDPNIDATNDSMAKDSVSKQLLLICVITVS